MKSINEMDAEFRARFESKRMEVKTIAELIEKAGLRDKVDGVYLYYEGADYIGISTFNLESLTVVREKLTPILGESKVAHVFELEDGKMNAFYRFTKYPLFSLRLVMSPEEFPIKEILPGYRIDQVGAYHYDVVKIYE